MLIWKIWIDNDNVSLLFLMEIPFHFTTAFVVVSAEIYFKDKPEKQFQVFLTVMSLAITQVSSVALLKMYLECM